jgi:tetratricopeptide (TPR) repeat protein
MFKVIALGSVLFCAATAAEAVVERPATKSSSALRAYNQGIKHANEGNCRAAMPYLDQAISDDRDFGDAFYARGYCRQQMKNFESASMDLSDAVRLSPGLLDARSLRGAVRLELDQTDAALEDFEYVLARKPTDATSLLERGVISLRREDADAAIRDFKAFVKHHPDHAATPQVRKVLASLGGAPAPASPRASAGRPSAPRQEGAAPSAGSSRVSAEAIRRAQALLSGQNTLSEQIGRKVLRGERAEATGEMRTPSRPGVQKEEPEIEIISPQ